MKLSSLLIAAALMVGTAAPALAFWPMPQMGTTINNTAFIRSTAQATSLTGMNTIETCNTCGPQVRMPTMFGGWPMPAPATVNYINSGAASSNSGSEVGGVNFTGALTGLKTVNNFAKVSSLSDAMSGTGLNTIVGSGTNTIVSGAAGSLSSSYVHDINVTGLFD